MSGFEWTVADQSWLVSVGVADAPAVRVDSSWVAERVLQAAVAGVLTGPNLDVLTDRQELMRPVCLAGREISGAEATALTDMTTSGLLVWVGCRITATAHGREALVRWARDRRLPRRGRRGRRGGAS